MEEIEEIPIRCVIAECENSMDSAGLAVDYHPFPIFDRDLLSIWLLKCGVSESADPSTLFVCSKHFSHEDYDDSYDSPTWNLKPSAFPNRNLGVLSNWLEDQTSDEEPVNVLDQMLDQSCRVVVLPSYSVDNDATISEVIDEDEATEGPASSPRTSGPIAETTERPRVKPANPFRGFCEVITCKSRIRLGDAGFHAFPLTKELAQSWMKAAFLAHKPGKRCRLICRRHFTTNDYLKPAAPGKLPRLRKGSVPSQNLPANSAVIRLAAVKLKQDLIRRNQEYKTCSLEEQFTKIPELAEAFNEYKEEMRKMGATDPIPLPVLRRRGELLGPGEPVQSEFPLAKPRKQKQRTPEEEKLTRRNRKEMVLRKRLQLRQLDKRRMPVQKHLRVNIRSFRGLKYTKTKSPSKKAASKSEQETNSVSHSKVHVDHSYEGLTNSQESPLPSGDPDEAPSSSTSLPPARPPLPDLLDSLADDLSQMASYDARVKVRNMMNRFRVEFKRQSLEIRAVLMELNRVERKLGTMKVNLANAIASEFENLYGPLPE